MAAPEAPLEPPKEPTTPKEDTQPYDDRLSEATTLFNDDQTDKVTQKQKPFFDFKRGMLAPALLVWPGSTLIQSVQTAISTVPRCGSRW